MEISIKYRGRVATTEDIETINELISKNPSDSRRSLSAKFCKSTNWIQSNGNLRDMVAKGYMLALYRAGYINLPEKKKNPPNPLTLRNKPDVINIDKTPISTNLRSILPLEFIQVRRTRLEKLFNSLIGEYHYLGYTQPVGEHLKYIVYAGARPVACIAFCSAPRHIAPRDVLIGWDAATRRKNIHLICYNTRFLILPWVNVKYLASHILSKTANIISSDWNRIYNHPVYYIETFVDSQRFPVLATGQQTGSYSIAV
ncbi:MAG: Druantia anti-phage system protein DruA [Candidatus Humimicrobiaceae bacterium]